MRVTTPDRSTALFRAVERGEVARVARLLAAGTDPNSLNRYGSTPLMVAALGADVAILHALVAAGADVDLQCPGGSTALMKAALWGCVDLVVALLRLGADPALTDAEGWNAAQIARARGHHGIAQLLGEWEPMREEEPAR